MSPMCRAHDHKKRCQSLRISLYSANLKSSGQAIIVTQFMCARTDDREDLILNAWIEVLIIHRLPVKMRAEDCDGGKMSINSGNEVDQAASATTKRRLKQAKLGVSIF